MISEFEINIIICFAVAGVAAATDLFTGRIPNTLTYSGILVGLGFSVLADGLPGFLNHFAAALFAASPFLLTFVYGGGGGGDVKIMAAIGALIGFPDILSVLAHALLVGAIMAAWLMIVGGRVRAAIVRVRLVVLNLPMGLKNAMELDPIGLAKDYESNSSVDEKHGVRFGIAAAFGLYWSYSPGVWHLPGL